VGIKTLVPMTTGLTNTLKRRMGAYDTAALMKVNMTKSGIVCRNIVWEWKTSWHIQRLLSEEKGDETRQRTLKACEPSRSSNRIVKLSSRMG